jgi:hypothetical protein
MKQRWAMPNTRKNPLKGNRVLLWIAALVLVFACVYDDNPSPTEPGTEGITVYEHPGFRGGRGIFFSDVPNLDAVGGPCGLTIDPETGEFVSDDWDDCISSIAVAPGWEATLFPHRHFKGSSLIVTSPISDLDDVEGPCGASDRDWDDCVSSILVRRPE